MREVGPEKCTRIFFRQTAQQRLAVLVELRERMCLQEADQVKTPIHTPTHAPTHTQPEYRNAVNTCEVIDILNVYSPFACCSKELNGMKTVLSKCLDFFFPFFLPVYYRYLPVRVLIVDHGAS